VFNHPSILQALSAIYAGSFLIHELADAFFALSAVVLRSPELKSSTRTWATSASRRPLAPGWCWSCRHASCAISDRGARAEGKSPCPTRFFLLVPSWGRLPMAVLATAATVIASQAVITGAFSVPHHAVHLGYLPRLRSTHTSTQTIGQIYIAWINWPLMISVLPVFVLETSAALAYAYGTAVTKPSPPQCCSSTSHCVGGNNRPPWLAIVGAATFLAIELLFRAASLTKITHRTDRHRPRLHRRRFVTASIGYMDATNVSRAAAAGRRGRA
jgi:KUP system potassium uptake protein